MPNWKKVITSGSDAAVKTLLISDTADGDALIGNNNILHEGITATANNLTVGSAVEATDATNATNAANVTTAADSGNAEHFVTFTDSSAATQQLKTDAGIKYNPSSNTVTVGRVAGTDIDAGTVTVSDTFDLRAGNGGIGTSGGLTAVGITNSSTYTGGGRLTLSGGAGSYIEATGYISSSVSVNAPTGSFEVLVGDTSQATSLEVDGPITASGGIISTNVEILTQGSARVSSITNTTDYWGPNYQGPYHTANWNRNVTPETDGNVILTRLKANTGFIVPYKCDLVGFDAIGSMQSGEDTPFSMSLFTADAINGMDLNSTSNTADGFTASLACTGISQGSTGYNRHRITGSCAVNLTPFSVVFPLVKVDAAGNDDSAMSLDVTYVVKIKRT